MNTTSNKIPSIKRFWRSVKKMQDFPYCWLWTAGRDTNGYGQFSIKGKAVSVHRFSYELHKGKIPLDNSYHGICVLHICDVPNCVNPNHLILGTQVDNIKDRDVKMRMSHKITKVQAEEIRKLYIPRKLTESKLAQMFGISRSTVGDILHRRIWK